jgi:hypothetical protein
LKFATYSDDSLGVDVEMSGNGIPRGMRKTSTAPYLVHPQRHGICKTLSSKCLGLVSGGNGNMDNFTALYLYRGISTLLPFFIWTAHSEIYITQVLIETYNI